MTQEEKSLLLRDLSARLPYRVKCIFHSNKGDIPATLTKIDVETEMVSYKPDGSTITYYNFIEYIKPYLRPMDSMTEEEKEDFYQNCLDVDVEDIRYENDGELPLPYNQKDKFIWFESIYIDNVICAMDWLNDHHFDYRGLIEKSLALEAPEGMYNVNKE